MSQVCAALRRQLEAANNLHYFEHHYVMDKYISLSCTPADFLKVLVEAREIVQRIVNGEVCAECRHKLRVPNGSLCVECVLPKFLTRSSA